MTQFARPTLNAAVDDGITLSAKLNGAFPALYTNHAGAAAPPSPEQGQMWVDTSGESANPPVHVLRQYTGTVWREIGTLNLTTGLFTTAGGLPLTGGTVTGPIRFPFGTAAAPSITFAGDTGTGIYRMAAGELGFALGGVQFGRMATSGFTYNTNIRIVQTNTDAALQLDANAGQNRSIWGRTGASPRWELQIASRGAETGGNSGSDFSISRHGDDGVSLGAVFNISRATGIVSAPIGVEGAFIASRPASGNADVIVATGANSSYSFFASPSGDAGIYNNLADRNHALFEAGGVSRFSGSVHATSAGFQCDGSSDWGGVYGVLAFRGNPSWADIDIQLLHQSGVFASMRLVVGNMMYDTRNDGNIVRTSDNAVVVWQPGSDKRIKKNIKPATHDALSSIRALEMVEFDYEDAYAEAAETKDIQGRTVRRLSGQKVGFTAQQVQEHLPDVVSVVQPAPSVRAPDSPPTVCVAPKDMLTVHTLELIPYLVRAIQQQQEQIDELKKALKNA
jgi:hypothetical protein